MLTIEASSLAIVPTATVLRATRAMLRNDRHPDGKAHLCSAIHVAVAEISARSVYPTTAGSAVPSFDTTSSIGFRKPLDRTQSRPTKASSKIHQVLWALV